MSRARFAPSPTGYLHLGHAFSALECQRQADEILLRFEDIDFTRVREEYYAAIEEDLAWLGLNFSGERWRQQERMEIYKAALDDLIQRGLAYPCFCTRKDLSQYSVDAPHGSGSPVYSGKCRDLSEDEAKQKMADGVPYAWRLNAQKAAAEVGDLSFRDTRFGEVVVNHVIPGDVVIARKDIQTSYHIAVVVDDAAQGITHIIRGEDLLESTHVHRVLQALWQYPEPTYCHHALVVDDEGRRLAKRHQSLALLELRKQGMCAEEVKKLARLNLEG